MGIRQGGERRIILVECGLSADVDASEKHLIAFVAIAFISILSRRLKRLVVDEISA
jgi:hypothetical protein